MFDFESAYLSYIQKGSFFESPEYYARYKSRYYAIFQAIKSLQLKQNASLFEIGGGQVGILCNKIMGFEGTVGDVSDAYSSYIKDLGLNFLKYDLVNDEPFCANRFDVVVLSEVIEHLPIPPYLVLTKLRSMLKKGGNIIITTPNLLSIRNIMMLIMGKNIFDNFFYPSTDQYCIGHIVEYSSEHLKWQLNEAGFEKIEVSHKQFDHVPNKFIHKILYLIGKFIFFIPRFRQSLIAIARNPQ